MVVVWSRKLQVPNCFSADKMDLKIEMICGCEEACLSIITKFLLCEVDQKKTTEDSDLMDYY